jgi:hypothetical protein
MQSITVNGVRINVHGNANINVDRWGNVNVNVTPKTVYIDRPVWPRPNPIYFPYNTGNNPKHWLK